MILSIYVVDNFSWDNWISADKTVSLYMDLNLQP